MSDSKAKRNVHFRKSETSTRYQAKTATAFHEAGHTVVQVYYELPFTKVTIVPAKGTRGSLLHPSLMWIDFSGCLVRERKKAARQMILGCYAGLHAQRLVDPEAPDWHAQGDWEQARDLSIEYLVLPRRCIVGDEHHMKFMAGLAAESRRLVRRLRRPIETLAEGLLKRKTMNENEVLALVRPLLPHS